MPPPQIEIGVAQWRREQEFSQGAFAHGLARPFLGGDDHRARLAVAGDGLRTGLRTINQLGEPGLGDREVQVPPGGGEDGVLLTFVMSKTQMTNVTIR